MNQQLKNFFIHFSIVTLVFLLVSYLFFYVYLPYLTLHGQNIEVPDLQGKTLDECEKILTQKKLKLKINDSTYVPNSKKRSVIAFFPAMGEKVKENRSIYVTIASRIPPKVKMPKLTGTSLKSSEMVLNSYGLILGKINYKHGAHEGEVLKQSVNNIDINEGVLVEKGTVIDLLVSLGVSDEEIDIPNLVNMSLKEARKTLMEAGLELGSVVYERNSNFEMGMVTKQKPESKEESKIKMGETIDIWLNANEPENIAP